MRARRRIAPMAAVALAFAAVGCLLLVSAPQLTAALGCPAAGCDGTHSFDTQLPVPGVGAKFTLLYRNMSFGGFAASDAQASQSGCVFGVHGVTTCIGPTTNAVTGEAQPSVVTFVSATGAPVWTSGAVSSPTLPMVLANGVTIAYDGEALYMWTAAGQVTQQSALFSGHTAVWSLGASAQAGFMLLSFAHGSAAAFLQDGVPIASRWFNDTTRATAGVWAPFGAPVAYEQRVYIPTRWYATPKDGAASYFTNDLRIIALEIRQSTVNRTAVVWTATFVDAVVGTTPGTPLPDPTPIALLLLDTAAGPQIYLNAYTPTSSVQANTLLSVVDVGTSFELVFVADQSHGPLSNPTDTAMAADPRASPFDPNSSSTVWVMQQAGTELARFDAADGTILEQFKTAAVLNGTAGWSPAPAITSQLLVGRMAAGDNADPMLLFAWGDGNGNGFISALHCNDQFALPVEAWRIATGNDAFSADGLRGQLALIANNQAATGVVYVTPAGLVAYDINANADADADTAL